MTPAPRWAATTRPPGASPQAAKHRRGIPQYLQLHTLVTGGLQAIEAELPGFKAEVRGGAGGWAALGGAKL